MEFTFNNGVCNIDVIAGVSTINVPNIGYTVQPNGQIIPNDYAPLIRLVENFGLTITPQQVQVTYNPATDTHAVQFGPVKLNVTKQDC